MSDKSLYAALAESVGPMAKLPNNGASYHTGEQIITHLNRVLGPENWSFRILEIGEEEDSDECFCFGEITANVGGVVVVKQDYGSQAFKRARSTGKFVSKWDDKKAAATDALKRCARLLGVGLDAWANERAPSWHPDQDAPAAPKPARRAEKPADPPKAVAAAAVLTGAQVGVTKNERAELEWKYVDLAEDAVALGHQHAEKIAKTKPETLDDATLKASVEKLTAWVEANKPADTAA